MHFATASSDSFRVADIFFDMHEVEKLYELCLTQ